MLSPAALPRLMSRTEVAAYCGITTSAFADWQRRGIMPGPVPGTRRWDKTAVDRALDKAGGMVNAEPPESAYQRWKREQNARAS
jgi:hypothetical protein